MTAMLVMRFLEFVVSKNQCSIINLLLEEMNFFSQRLKCKKHGKSRMTMNCCSNLLGAWRSSVFVCLYSYIFLFPVSNIFSQIFINTTLQDFKSKYFKSLCVAWCFDRNRRADFYGARRKCSTGRRNFKRTRCDCRLRHRRRESCRRTRNNFRRVSRRAHYGES